MPDTELDRAIEQLQRMRSPRSDNRAWYEIVNAADKKRKAKIRIYDEIGWWGTSARTFAQELDDLDVDEIELRLNSPGGNAWDGLAIYNSLRAHPATVTVTVDGMAASAASFIAMAGDKVLMNRGSQMMIHDASGIVIGNASDMEKFADVLNRMSDSIASIYTARAGGSIAEWRDAMREETWYKADEAVEAGLADATVNDTGPDVEATAGARFDLTAYAYAYAGRDAAPAPKISPRPQAQPPAPAPISAAEAAARIHAASTANKTPDANPAAGSPHNPEGAAEMQFTDEERIALRTRFNLSADAGDDAIKAALLAPPPTNPPSNTPAPESTPVPVATSGKPGSTMTIDSDAWTASQERIKNLEAQAAKQARNERDKIIDDAVKEGKFAPARKEHWARLWDADPEGTRQVIDGLAKNVVPVAPVGYAVGDDTEFDDDFRRFFPPEPAKKGV